ncbi:MULTISPECIES: hypothetical protein [unclassified Streptomyces]|uniref:hypothetical protein n=1 Tax=unclassified Streptomyces TaxID=2593676 RepID=UPI0033BA8578
MDIEERPAQRRRRGRTALLIAAAAVIGIVGGTATGYRIQADRPPTPLPPLNQPGLAYPAKPLPKGQEPRPLSAAEDRAVRTEGDLRKLLLPRPKGARDLDNWSVGDGWLDPVDYALEFKDEDYMFENLVGQGLRRIAIAGWSEEEHRDTTIKLVQFHAGYQRGAALHASGQRAYMPEDKNGAGNDGDPINGSTEGRYYLYPVKNKPGYLPMYRARAIFHRGDVMVDIDVFDTERIGKDVIRKLAEQQLERL